jgi:hypothetical protein
MPWNCCGNDLDDRQRECPQCGAPKRSWTIRYKATRHFVIPKRKPKGKTEVFVGSTAVTNEDDEAAALQEALVVPALQAALVADLVEAETAPSPAHVVTLRVFPEGLADPIVLMKFHLGDEEVAQLELALPEDAVIGEDGYWDLRLVFVHGDAPIGEAGIEGVYLIDVSDETQATGYVERIEIGGLGKGECELIVQSVLSELPVAADEEAEESSD